MRQYEDTLERLSCLGYSRKPEVKYVLREQREVHIEKIRKRLEDFGLSIKQSGLYKKIEQPMQPYPNHNWCVGCSPDNCTGCGTAPAERRMAKAYAWESDNWGEEPFISRNFEEALDCSESKILKPLYER